MEVDDFEILVIEVTLISNIKKIKKRINSGPVVKVLNLADSDSDIEIFRKM